jgi:hypothetical protein
MRRLLLPVAVLGVVMAMPWSGRAQDAECKDIINNAMRAQGGADKLKAIKATTAKAKGTITGMGMDFDFTIELFAQHPDKNKAVIDLNIMGQQLQIVNVFDGKKGWKSVLGKVEDADKEEIDEHLAMQHVEEVTNLYKIQEDRGMKMSPLGESKVGDTPVVGVQVTKKDKRDVNLYFDKKTHLLIKAEYRALDPFTKQEVTQEKLLSNYKEISGVKMPTKLVLNNDGKKFMEAEVSEMRAVEKFDDSIFAKPQMP